MRATGFWSQQVDEAASAGTVGVVRGVRWSSGCGKRREEEEEVKATGVESENCSPPCLFIREKWNSEMAGPKIEETS
jgi:hypothetical protein